MKFEIKNPKKGTRVEFEEFEEYAILYIHHNDFRYAWYTESISSWSPEEGKLDIFEIRPSDDFEGYNIGPKPESGFMQIVFPDLFDKYYIMDFYARNKETEHFVFLKKDWWKKEPINKQKESV